jgi:hypothetical protein
VSPETRNLDTPIRLTPRRLWIGAAVCVGAGTLVAVLGFSSAASMTPPIGPNPAIAEQVTGTELPTYPFETGREFRPRLPR